MESFCTLFDSNYLVKGLAMYYSLKKVKESFKLYVITFDDEACDILSELKLPGLVPISLSEFEDDRLLRIKKTRTRGEYCWTCSSFSIKYVLEKYGMERLTYLDSDLFFYRSTDIIFDEFIKSGKSVLITEHDYTPQYDISKKYGRYCVQYMTFVNNPDGLNVLNWWCDRCDEWCYDRLEDGKFGDQKYLDDWTERFKCVYVLENKKLTVAPWNVQKYTVTDGPLVDGYCPVFYHFHKVRWFDYQTFHLGDFKLLHDDIQYIYIPYLRTLQHVLGYIQDKWNSSFEKGITGYPSGKKHIKESILHPMGFVKSRKIVRHLTNTYNVIRLD